MECRRLSSVALGLVVLAACSGGGSTQRPPPPPVRVHVVSLTGAQTRISATAPIRAERRATLRTEAPGRVAQAPLREGATVAEGDVIIRLDRPITAATLAQGQARVAQARASLSQLTRARENAESLAAQSASTPNALAEARDREAESLARLAEAEAGLRAARAGVAESVLRAPFGGVLADLSAQEGEYLAAGAVVGTLVDPSRLEADLLLDPVEARGVVVDASVTVRTPTLPGASFEGRVAFVGDVLDPRSSRLPVRVSIDDPEHRLRPGAIADYEISIGEPREVIRLPEVALSRRMGRTQVFVVIEGVAQTRAVTVGETQDGEVEILDGLSQGEQVVVEGGERVVAGEAVRVVPEASDPEAAP